MTSSSKCFFLGSLVVLLLLFLGSTSTMALTKDINSTCYRYSVDNSFVHNKTFCLQTLTAYPPAVSATNMVELVKVTLDLGSTQAKERAGFVAGLEKEPTFKKYFETCSESYATIVNNFRGARLSMEDGAAGYNRQE
ncbi:BnaUnng03320D, partial [Brassica napus]